MRLLRRFIDKRLPDYETARNQPQIGGTSELSAYLHFGHLGPLIIALAVRDADAPETAKTAFLEELIVRRELAINHVARNPQYDRLAGSPEWAENIGRARCGSAPVLLHRNAIGAAETHDPLWNAAQLEMVVTGRMHGYLRMYWARRFSNGPRRPKTHSRLPSDSMTDTNWTGATRTDTPGSPGPSAASITARGGRSAPCSD